MPGTRIGGLKAKASNYKRHGKNFYKDIGTRGGAAGKGPEYQKGGSKAAGFAANPDLAKVAGAKGGANGKRGKKPRVKKVEPVEPITPEEKVESAYTRLVRKLREEL